MKFSGKLKSEGPGFQIAPMIDVVFLLLVFFVTSQIYAQWETEIGISLPTAKTAENRPRQEGEIILNITRDGVVKVSGQTLEEDRLGSVLQRLALVYPGQPVILRADRKTEYAHVVRVLDVCRRSNIWNVSFATAMADDGEDAATP